jgi:hypothetical protein
MGEAILQGRGYANVKRLRQAGATVIKTPLKAIMNFNRRIYLFSLTSARLMEWKKSSRKCLLVSAAWNPYQ